MRLDPWPEPTDLEKRILARGGARGKAEALLTVLAARAVAVSDEARNRILACADAAQLDRWLARVVTVESVEELFDGEEA